MLKFFQGPSTEITHEKIKEKITKEKKIYLDLLMEIKRNCNNTKKELDIYYNYLHKIHIFVQTSVILLSTGSSFSQIFLNEDNKEIINIITLSISSYSGLVLSIAKFFKLDEKKENVHNLKERFVELHTRIVYYIDLLDLWKDESYYDKDCFSHIENYEKILNKWKKTMEDIETAYFNIIDIKKSLHTEFYKIIDFMEKAKYSKKREKKTLSERTESPPPPTLNDESIVISI